MLKSVNQDNGDFFYSTGKIKNKVDNVNKNLTPSSAHKGIHIDKSVNDSNIQSNNNFATPADIFNQDNDSELPQKAYGIRRLKTVE